MELIILKAHEKILSSESFFNIMKYYSDLKYAKNIKKIKVFKQKKIKSRSHIIFEPKINQPILEKNQTKFKSFILKNKKNNFFIFY